MTASADKPKLDACGCCQKELPIPRIENRPGQPALSYRIGTHASFLARMRALLHRQLVPDETLSLAALTTREKDDPSIAFLDAWATVADVLTFYQERIANEGYLRTASERRSILELARAIGYELNPGVAAGTYLAFTVEAAKGAPERATVEQGTKVVSIPGQGQKPQTFETAESIEARVEWNALQPQLTEAQKIGRGTDELFLKGIDTQLQPGDAILLVGDHRESFFSSERWDFRILQTVTLCREEGYTVVTWKPVLGHQRPTVEPADNPRVFAFRQRAALFGFNAPDWRAMPGTIKTEFDKEGKQRTRWPNYEIQTWQKNLIDLDAVYPKILVDSWVVLLKPTYVELYKVKEVSTASRTDFTLTAKTTRLRLDTREHLNNFGLRETVVFAQSEQLELAERPVVPPVFGNEIVLKDPITDVQSGQAIIVIGKPVKRVKIAERVRVVRKGKIEEEVEPVGELFLVSAAGLQQELEAGELLEIVGSPVSEKDGRIKWNLRKEDGFEGSVTAQPQEILPEPATKEDEVVSEVAVVEVPPPDDGEGAPLILRQSLRNTYDRTTVKIFANVVRATHGETVEKEILGGGDGAQANQSFALKKPPLTYVSAPTPSGTQSTLVVRVNGVQWNEAPSLYGLDPGSQSYIIRIDNDSKASVIVGNGESGARLPTGSENVVATYRAGIGPEGEVEAGKLSLLPKRPLGIREVTNPLPATGAAPPETLANARGNAPVTVLTLDRIVSLSDFEDFTRAFTGIGKAQANVVWNGNSQLVHLTVAAEQGHPVLPDSDLYRNLVGAIDRVRDPHHPVFVQSYEGVLFSLTATVLIDSAYVAAQVLTDVEAALLKAFSFEERSFGQAVTAAEAVKVIQQVPGVLYTDFEGLYGATAPDTAEQNLQAKTARWEGKVILPAQLLLLNPTGVNVTELQS